MSYRDQFTGRVTALLYDVPVEVPCMGDGPLVLALVSEQGASVTHRPSGWKVLPLGYDVETELDRAVAVRDELLALDIDWTVADPTVAVSPEVRAQIVEITHRELYRFHDDDGFVPDEDEA